jgi:FHS family Na+ dependent glucose MFS transporter 1
MKEMSECSEGAESDHSQTKSLISPSEAGSKTDLHSEKRFLSANLIVNGENDTFEKFSVSNKIKWLQTITYYCIYIAEGFTWGCIGPTLMLLAEQNGTTQESIGILFVARGTGWIIGSLIAAKAYEWFKGHHIMFFGTICMTILMAVIPFIKNLWLFLIVSGLLGTSLALPDIGCNTLLFAVWREKVGPYMQFLHFCFGVGSTVAPFIVALIFLCTPRETQLLWSYLTLSAAIAMTCVLPLLSPTPGACDKGESNPDLVIIKQIPRVTYYTLVGAVALFLFLYVGAEVAYGGWLATYSITVYHFGDAQGAAISSGFWMAITAGRLLAVPFTAKFSGKIILLVDIIAATLCTVALILFDSLRIRMVLWVITLLYGLALSSMYGTAFSLSAEGGVPITSRASSIFVIGGSIGEVTVPVIVGWLVVRVASTLLLWSLFIISLSLFALYALILYTLARAKKALQQDNEALSPSTVMEQVQQQQRLLEEGNTSQPDKECEMQHISPKLKTNHTSISKKMLQSNPLCSNKLNEVTKKTSETNMAATLKPTILNPVS